MRLSVIFHYLNLSGDKNLLQNCQVLVPFGDSTAGTGFSLSFFILQNLGISFGKGEEKKSLKNNLFQKNPNKPKPQGFLQYKTPN